MLTNINFLNDKIFQYFHQVYSGYGYLYKASGEIFWKQLFLDPIQDTLLETGFKKVIQYGYNQNDVNLEEAGLHALLHEVPLPFGLDIHTFGVEFCLHAGVKTVATLIFPFIYPVYIPASVANTAIIPIKFFGVNPLEGLHSLNTMPKFLFGDNNTISTGIKYISYGEGYYQERANDESFYQYMSSYDDWMESVDATMHAYGEISILYNNLHLSDINIKTSAYLYARTQLYFNTLAEEKAVDKEIEQTRSLIQNDTCSESIEDEQEHQNSWSDWLYENKDLIITSSVSAITPFVMPMIYPFIVRAYHNTANYIWGAQAADALVAVNADNQLELQGAQIVGGLVESLITDIIDNIITGAEVVLPQPNQIPGFGWGRGHVNCNRGCKHKTVSKKFVEPTTGQPESLKHCQPIEPMSAPEPMSEPVVLIGEHESSELD